MTDARDRLFRRIEGRADDLVDLTRELIRLPTVNPPGEGYVECAELIGRRLKSKGFQVVFERAEGTPGDCEKYPRMNVIARIEGRAPGPCVHFNSHIDVVPAGNGWTVDPFRGEVREGRVYGRGACDMKGGLAASIIAENFRIAPNSAKLNASSQRTINCSRNSGTISLRSAAFCRTASAISSEEM